MIQINYSDIVTAFENHNSNITHYLDLKTGEVVFTADDNFIEDVDNDSFYRIKESPETFIRIDRISPHDGFKIMEDFTSTVENSEIKKILSDELYRPKPFKSFKSVLSKYDVLKKEFTEFKNNEMKIIVSKWLIENNIKADLV